MIYRILVKIIPAGSIVYEIVFARFRTIYNKFNEIDDVWRFNVFPPPGCQGFSIDNTAGFVRWQWWFYCRWEMKRSCESDWEWRIIIWCSVRSIGGDDVLYHPYAGCQGRRRRTSSTRGRYSTRDAAAAAAWSWWCWCCLVACSAPNNFLPWFIALFSPFLSLTISISLTRYRVDATAASRLSDGWGSGWW